MIAMIKKLSPYIFNIAKFVYFNIENKLIKTILRSFVLPILAVCILNIIFFLPLMNRYTINHVDNSHKRLLIRSQIEDIRNTSCEENNFKKDQCPLIVRSFFTDNGQAWCMGHADMLKDTDRYFKEERRSLISNECYNFLANKRHSFININVFEKKCKFLSRDCIFKSHDKYKHVNVVISCVEANYGKASIDYILYKHIFGDRKRLSCFALVDGNWIESFAKNLNNDLIEEIRAKIVNFNANYFDE